MVEKNINVDTPAAISDQTLPSPEVLFQTLSLRHSCVGLMSIDAFRGMLLKRNPKEIQAVIGFPASSQIKQAAMLNCCTVNSTCSQAHTVNMCYCMFKNSVWKHLQLAC